MVNCRPHLRIVQTLTHATQLHRTSTLCRDGQRPQNRVNPIHKCIRINVGAAPVAQLDRVTTLEVGILNQISAAFGVAYTETRCATTLLNWTEVGPKLVLTSLGLRVPTKKSLLIETVGFAKPRCVGCQSYV